MLSDQMRSESLLTNTISPELTDLVVQSSNTSNSITVNDTKAVYAGSHEFTNGLNSIGEIRTPIVRGFSGATTGLASHSGSACYCVEADDSLRMTGTSAVVFPATTYQSTVTVNGELSVNASAQINCSSYEGLAGTATTIKSSGGSAYYQIDASNNLHIVGSTANVYAPATFTNGLNVGTVKPNATTLSLQAPAGGRKIDISDTSITVSGTLSVADISTTSHITMPSSTILTTDTITGTAGFGTVNVQSNSTNARLNLNNNGDCTLESKGVEASIVCGTTPNQAELSLNSNQIRVTLAGLIKR